MVQTLEDVKKVHDIANRLTELGIPERVTNRIHRVANIERKRMLKEGKSK